jgi:hypothetical protein
MVPALPLLQLCVSKIKRNPSGPQNGTKEDDNTYKKIL